MARLKPKDTEDRERGLRSRWGVLGHGPTQGLSKALKAADRSGLAAKAFGGANEVGIRQVRGDELAVLLTLDPLHIPSSRFRFLSNTVDTCTGIVDAKACEPAEPQVILHLLHQLPLGPHREQDLDQAGQDQPFWRAQKGGRNWLKPFNSASMLASASFTTCESCVEDVTRDAFLPIDVLNSQPLASSVPRNITPSITVRRVNHVPQNRSRADFFSSLLGACSALKGGRAGNPAAHRAS
jgi:hypothetical protein